MDQNGSRRNGRIGNPEGRRGGAAHARSQAIYRFGAVAGMQTRGGDPTFGMIIDI
jgi:hypothetical protein